MCESGIFVGGSLEDSQNTRTNLIVIGKGRGLTAKPQAFFFLWSEAQTGGGGVLSPRPGGAPAVFRRRGAAGKVQLDVLELLAGSTSPEGRRPQQISDGGTRLGGGAKVARHRKGEAQGGGSRARGRLGRAL
jgi:hypothetical protein